MTELERARSNLADAEASLTAGTNPYAQQNVQIHRRRVARLEAVADRPRPAPAPTPAPAAPSGTRAQRLARLAHAFGVDEQHLEAALADGLTPDEFAVIASEIAAANAKALAIINDAA